MEIKGFTSSSRHKFNLVTFDGNNSIISFVGIGKSFCCMIFDQYRVSRFQFGGLRKFLTAQLCLAVDSKDVIVAQHPTHSPHGLCLEWGFLMLPFEGFPWRP